MQTYFLLFFLCISFQFTQAQTGADISVKYNFEELTTNASVVDIGSVEASTVGPARIFTIENTGDAPLLLTGGASKVWKTSERYRSFIIDETALPSEIAPGASATFSVTFAPSFYDFGELTMTATIHNNDANENPFVFVIKATGTASDIRVKHNDSYLVHDSSVVDFGTQTTGQSSLLTFTIENSGEAPLTFENNIFVGGANPESFIVDAGDLPSEIMPGGAAPFTIRFAPSTAGDKTAYIAIRTDDPDMDFFVFDIAGKGVLPLVPEIEVIHDDNEQYIWNDAGMSLKYPVVISRTGPAERITIRNVGTADLILTSPELIEISGINASAFVIDKSNLPPVIAPGASGYFYATLEPVTTGFQYASIAIPNNDGDENPFTFNIVGQGINPEIQVRQGGDLPSGGSVSFYSVPVGLSTYPYDFWIRNSGIGDLEFFSTPMVTKVSGDTADFIIDESSMTRTIPNYSERKFTITFRPLTTGKKNMVVSLLNSDLDEGNFTFTVTAKTGNLRGNGRMSGEGEIVVTYEENSSENAFPNPSKESFTIWTGGKNDEEVTGMVHNTTGIFTERFVWAGATRQKIGDQWKPGFYILEIRNSAGREVIKLIKE